jgi:2-polyprenyl-6-methoxyphenol hydroxylase-like FAD-dependent oxidoreductase
MGQGTDVDVLVVGAGPTGLMLAGECLRHGLSVRVIDTSTGPVKESRAIVVHARTLEILDDLGVGDAFVAKGKKLVGATLWAAGEPIVRADFDELETKHPYILSISQAETEGLLEGLVVERKGKVERETELLSFRQDGTGVTAKLRTKAGETTCRAAWIVGADGCRSTVRKALGIPFEGATYDDRFLLADVAIDWDVRDDRLSSYFGEDGLVACFPMPGGRWRLIGTARAGDERTEAPTLEEMQALFTARSGTKGKLADATWLARFRIHCRQVARYRDDRAFLCGDAAHVHSPAGGQGMNTGMHDAHNLAWKLALVHRGDARGALLDSYEVERHAVGKGLLAGTDAATKVGTLKNAFARGFRNEIARFLSSLEFVQARIVRDVAELGIEYRKSPIVREDVTGLLNARLGTAGGGETPTLGTVREFAAGPAAGARAPDGRVTVAGTAGTTRLLSELDTRKTNVLLFDGKSASPDGYARFSAVDAAVKERFGASVAVSVVTPRNVRPPELTAGIPVFLDESGELEQKYAAATECVYVVRPDLWIGYRAQPVSEEKLTAWLAGFLR